MSMENPRGGLRKRRRDPFVQVPSSTVDDFTVPFRSLGVLTWLLNKPDGWDVNSIQIANEGKGKTLRGRKAAREGREAVRTALRELALAGYYRLEKRRMLDRTFVMGTAVSETPVASWAAQAEFFGGKYVPLVEQPDGSFKVKYPDGTLLDDDFPPPEGQQLADDAGEDPDGSENLGDRFSGSEGLDNLGDGFSGSENPGPENPGPGEAATGNLSPIQEGLHQRGYTDSDHPSDDRRGEAADDRADAVQPALDGTIPAPRASDPKPPKEPTNHDLAMGIARSWTTYRASKGWPVVASNPLHAVKSLVLPFLDAGYTEDEVKRALNGIAEGLPSKAQMERALVTIRGRAPRPPAGVGGRPPAGALKVNDAWSDDARPVPAGAAAGGGW
ncbi:hypothetical protein ABZ671_18490 [Micromonospora sp. NPDC006766]|uniref:hypothetical protein n=1 Tax=Micromonospora sp. NPDC006766 TaxID=3154778 RepID=UPI0033C4B447